jgi:hypothetical protein
MCHRLALPVYDFTAAGKGKRKDESWWEEVAVCLLHKVETECTWVSWVMWHFCFERVSSLQSEFVGVDDSLNVPLHLLLIVVPTFFFS